MAPMGNQYAVGNTGGRPRKYENVEELIAKIDEYFDYIGGERGMEVEEDSLDTWERKPEPATITGLMLYLGFESKQSFHDYIKREEFSYTLRYARLKVEHEYEKKLHSNTTAGIIFALKNLGWADNTQITGPNGSPLMPSQPQVIINQVTGLPSLGSAEEDLSIEGK